MRFRFKLEIIFLVCMFLGVASSAFAQQKGQWVPGQMGLNAGVVPAPGFTYSNMVINYSASQLNDSNGNALPRISGTYSFWLDENIFMYVPDHKILGGYFAPYGVINAATGDLVADIPDLPGEGIGAGGKGISDTYVQPVNMGWHFKRADFNAGYAFVAPTGAFYPGSPTNVGSGYWGNFITTGTTYYITKNRGTSASLFTGWEQHGEKKHTNITPGQAFTMEWGVGQVLPLKKDMSLLLQGGVVGYDQWQVTSSSGTQFIGDVGIPESSLPFYSVHAIGFQTNIILPKKSLLGFFKYYDQYRALASVEGRTIVFGFSWTAKTKPPTATP